MKYRAKFCPWKKGQGWQEHYIVDRTADSLKDLFSQINSLQLDWRDNYMDYSIDIYNGDTKIEEFWYSNYEQYDITIDGVKYSGGKK